MSSPVVCREIFDENSQPSAEEISDYAQQLGIDPESESHLLPLAKDGLMQALPPPWKAYYDDKIQSHYYYNEDTKSTQWEHPLDNVYRELVKKARDASMQDDTCASVQDGVPIHRKGELPQYKQNFCPEEALEVTEKFLETFFPLLDSGADHRALIQGLYEDDATLTVTYCYKLRYGPIYRCFRNLFLYARFLDEGETDSVVGAMAITKLINRWPHTEHDPFTFTVDVLYHTETTTILRVSGILKLTAETLAEDEHLLSFTRTVVLYSEEGDEYKIHNEMVYWEEPSAAAARSAFRVNTVAQKKFNLKIEATTDEDLRTQLLKIFMKLTTMEKNISERCLEINSWNFKLALEHFTKLLKSNNLESLNQEVQCDA